MPTYEYRCKSCGESLEVVQSFTDDALTDCPACGAAGELRKVFGSIGITFKGSGFYKTDSRNGSSKSSTAASEKSESSSDSSSSSDSKTESKSETKADTKPKSDTKKKSSDSTSAA